jgi:Holliday junction DNA helicase RuvB
LGKTTLAHIIAKAMGTNLVVTAGPAIEKPGDLAGILTNLQVGDVLFIDEIHQIARNIEEYLYPAMEDLCLDLIIDSGPSARSVQVKLNPFTMVGATTRLGQLSSPLRSRFGVTCRLNYYSPEDLQHIVERSCQILRVPIRTEAALAIARRSRGTPRIANNLVKWVRDYAQVHRCASVDAGVVDAALDMLSIDQLGLDEMDLRILQVLSEQYGGGPAGIAAIAVAVGEEPSTIEEVYEPYLILQGLLRRTVRGREMTDKGYAHLHQSQSS